jgi:hypothetical protein
MGKVSKFQGFKVSKKTTERRGSEAMEPLKAKNVRAWGVATLKL